MCETENRSALLRYHLTGWEMQGNVECLSTLSFLQWKVLGQSGRGLNIRLSGCKCSELLIMSFSRQRLGT